ncbi:MAG TPA: CvpA family protein [Candidatus Korarchaeota archaeon]|nr:CvpA family protein [Candidatus Korarchaeota archaeon]
MYWVDILIIGVAVVSIIYGLRKGLIKEVFMILQILVPFLIAIRMSATGEKFVQPIVHNPKVSPGLGFIVIFAIAMVAVWISGTLLSKIIRFSGFGLADRILGGVFGVIKAGLITGFIFILVLTFVPGGDKYLEKSVFAPKALYITDKAVTLLPADLKEEFFKKFEQLKTIWKEEKVHIKPSSQRKT